MLLSRNILTRASPCARSVLWSNQLSGSVPPELGSLSALVNLQLRANALSGSIPDSLASLTALTYLALDTNALTGSIPLKIGNLSSLRFLCVHRLRSRSQLTPTHAARPV